MSTPIHHTEEYVKLYVSQIKRERLDRARETADPRLVREFDRLYNDVPDYGREF